jgi:hypothetical protein
MGQNRQVIVAAILLLSFVVPAALSVLVALGPAPSVLDLVLLTCAIGAWMSLLVLVNWWEFTSVHLRWAWCGVFLAAVAWRALRVGESSSMPPPGAYSVVWATALLPALWLLVNAVRARRPSGLCLEIAAPVAGRLLVTDGGDGARSFLVNYHYGFGRHRASGVNASMRFAMDLVVIGPGGCESRGFIPTDNAAYRIWGCQLLAPCDGRVVHVVNEVGDNRAFGPDRPYGVGNHIVVSPRDGQFVVLGHLQRGSVTVAAGQAVRSGDPIARVGNSGWTERPHLHMQAMKSAAGDWWHGEPLPICIRGRFLVRNQCVPMDIPKESC